MEHENLTWGKLKALIEEKEAMINLLTDEKVELDTMMKNLLYEDKLLWVKEIEKFFEKSSHHVFSNGRGRKIVILLKPEWIVKSGKIRWCSVNWYDDIRKDPEIYVRSIQLENIGPNTLHELRTQYFNHRDTVKPSYSLKKALEEVRKILSENYTSSLDDEVLKVYSDKEHASMLCKWVNYVLVPVLEKKWKVKEASKKYGL